jgi:hypothetical protein
VQQAPYSTQSEFPHPTGHEYVDKGLQYYEDRHREQQVQILKQRAAKLGLQLVAAEVA